MIPSLAAIGIGLCVAGQNHLRQGACMDAHW